MTRLAGILTLLLLAACSGDRDAAPTTRTAEHPTMSYKEYAIRFASALTDSDFSGAHEMLAPNLQARYSAGDLKTAFDEMVEYGESVPRVDGFVQTMDDWPARGPDDLGWVYVSISGDDFGEAVTVVVTTVDGAMAIGQLEWGRP